MIAISVPCEVEGRKTQIVVSGILPGTDDLPEDPKPLFLFATVAYGFIVALCNSAEIGLAIAAGGALTFWIIPSILEDFTEYKK